MENDEFEQEFQSADIDQLFAKHREVSGADHPATLEIEKRRQDLKGALVEGDVQKLVDLLKEHKVLRDESAVSADTDENGAL